MQVMRRILLFTLPIALCAAMAGSSTKAVAQEEVPRITKEDLKANLDNEEFVIVDVRILKDWNASDYQIKGARRENPMDVNFWHDYPKDKTMILYCA
jgi:hypothetical protein